MIHASNDDLHTKLFQKPSLLLLDLKMEKNFPSVNLYRVNNVSISHFQNFEQNLKSLLHLK